MNKTLLSTTFVWILLSFRFNFAQTPDSLLNQALVPFTKSQSIEGSLKRYQFFKGKMQEAAASFKFDLDNGSYYCYTAPSKIDIFIQDSAQFSIDPQKKNGFKFSYGNMPELTDLDPVGRFFNYFSKQLKLNFSGSIDSMVIFHHVSNDGTIDFSTGIHRDQKRLDFIEFFRGKQLIQQVMFTYDNDYNLKTIVSRYPIGNELMRDSITLRYKSSKKSISPSAFAIPSGIIWK